MNSRGRKNGRATLRVVIFLKYDFLVAYFLACEYIMTSTNIGLKKWDLRSRHRNGPHLLSIFSQSSSTQRGEGDSCEVCIIFSFKMFNGFEYVSKLIERLCLRQWNLLRPPAHPFEAILLYDRNQLKRHVILCFRLP